MLRDVRACFEGRLRGGRAIVFDWLFCPQYLSRVIGYRVDDELGRGRMRMVLRVESPGSRSIVGNDDAQL